MVKRIGEIESDDFLRQGGKAYRRAMTEAVAKKGYELTEAEALTIAEKHFKPKRR